MNDQSHPTHLLMGYLGDQLEPDLASEVREHLAGCVACQATARKLRAHLHVAELDDQQALPGPHVKHHLMARVQQTVAIPARDSRLAQRVWYVVRIASMVSIFAVAFYLLYALNQHELAVAVLLAPTPSIHNMQSGLPALVNDPQTSVHSLIAGSYAPAAEASLYTRKGDVRIGLIVEQLPPAPPDHVYQLWAADQSASIPLGTFAPEHGHVELLAHAPAAIEHYTEAMVTIEPIGGSAQPSSKIVWVVRL